MNARILTSSLAVAALITASFASSVFAGGCHIGGGYGGGYGGGHGGGYAHGGGYGGGGYGHGGGYGGGYAQGGYNNYCFGNYNYSSCYNYTYCQYVQPCYYQGYCLPPLGFQSCSIPCVGEKVTYVQCESIAWCMGLRCHDVILQVNGCPLQCRNDWYAAYYGALCNGGCLELTIRQHCGAIVTLHYQFPCSPYGG